MINSFQKYMCSTCKSKVCDKGIALIKLNNMIIAKCTDYEKDENKVKGYEKPGTRTAKHMRKFCHGCRNYEKCFPSKKGKGEVDEYKPKHK